MSTDGQLGHLPEGSALHGLKEFGASKSADAAGLASGAVANILSQLSECSSLAKNAVVKLVPTAPGLPALSKKLVERIAAGQYVDFAEEQRTWQEAKN